MRRFSTTFFLSLFIVALASIVSAQQSATISVPNLIRYSGTLKDSQGVPSVRTTVGVTFAIYKQQDGGAPIWMETQNVTTDAGGNYSVVLGSTTSAGLPSDLFSQQDQRWLGVQVQGLEEQPRALMVSVPYAFKAHEAETLGGKRVSDFVLATGEGTSSNSNTTTQAAPASTNSLSSAGSTNSDSAGPTNFSGSTTDQIVGVTQSGTGEAINATAIGKAIIGTATAPSGTAYGVQGVATGTAGVGLIGTETSTTGFTYGLRGTASSTSGTGVRGIDIATSGGTTGISGYVISPSGTAAAFNNAAGGKIISGQNNGVEKFSVDGSGNVNALGSFTGSGTGLTGIQFSQLGGTLQYQQFIGEYGNPVNLMNSMNMFMGNFTGSYIGDGSGLMGVLPAAGSPNYIQNNNTPQPQAGAGFNIDGMGTVGQTLSANIVTTATTFQIGGGPSTSVLSIGTNPTNGNVFLGMQAGGNYPQPGTENTFSGAQAGYSNNGSSANTFTGYQAGYSTTYGQQNTFTGVFAGNGNTGGGLNSYYGFGAGGGNTIGMNNSAFGAMAGSGNNNGNFNIYIGSPGQSGESNTIRIGATNQQGFAYMAGIYGNAPSGALPVIVNANGQLGTGPAGGSGVTSWNGRTGTVVPQTGDYSFPMIGGSLSPSQVPAGSANYIQNGTTQQASANFAIDGSGSANSFVSTTTYQIAGAGSVVSIGNPADSNLFLGSEAGLFNPAGSGYNVIAGFQAGYNNTGTNNTFYGYQAGAGNKAGSSNVFIGYETGGPNESGGSNVFLGTGAGGRDTTGGSNVFSGSGAGTANNTGSNNTFYGYQAGANNTSGSQNIFIGNNAGSYITTGSSDIYIGTQGVQGDYNERNVTRLGDPSAIVATFIAGVFEGTINTASGVGVYVDAYGQLGTIVSSRRFKEQIADMGDSTSALMNLRPVTFLYKPEYSKGDRTLQYGLIAEEVAQVYPEMVAYDKDGQPYTVRYQYLTPMLLNEVQKQYRRAEQESEIVAAQQAQIKAAQLEVESLKQQLQLQNATLQERLARLEKLVGNQSQVVAQK